MSINEELKERFHRLKKLHEDRNAVCGALEEKIGSLAQEFAARTEEAADLSHAYNRCLRCGRKIKAPQVYGRICARKIKDGVVDKASQEKGLQRNRARFLLAEARS